MSHSTSRPYPKSLLRFPVRWRWSEAEFAKLVEERAEDERERLRVADMMAERFVSENWFPVQELIDDPVRPFLTDLATARVAWRDSKRRTEGVRTLLQEFWRERV